MHIYFTKIKAFIITHKIWSAVIAIVVIFAGVSFYKKVTAGTVTPTYVVSAATKGTIVSSVTGSGQVSASNQFSLQSKASGNITSVSAKVGDTLKEGDLIATVDSTDALYALQSAELSLKKLEEPADQASLISAQNSVQTAQTSSTKAFSSGASAVVSTFLDMPSVISGMDAILYQRGGYLYNNQKVAGDQLALNQIQNAGTEYDAAKRQYESVLLDYEKYSLSTASGAEISSMLSETYPMLQNMLNAIKDTNSAVEYVKNSTLDTSSAVSSAESSLSSLISKVTSDANAVSSAQNDIISSDQNINQSQASLSKVIQGTDSLDIQSSELNVAQKREAYNDTFIRAPFDGVLAALSVKKGDPVSNGTSIGTFITQDKVADITLNEVDVSKIKVGDKATLTFDAIDGLTIAGQVAEINLVGTVSQGVVTYDVKIAFATDDSRVLPGMSVSAAIITDTHADVVVVPSSAVKTNAAGSYVEEFSSPQSTNIQGFTTSETPKQVPVEVGLSDDTNTEIISGVNEGDQVVIKTTSASKTTTSQTPSILNAVGGRAAGGAAGGARNVRIGG